MIYANVKERRLYKIQDKVHIVYNALCLNVLVWYSQMVIIVKVVERNEGSSMSKMKVMFHNIDEIQEFINIVNKYPFDMALVREQLEVGATSILAIINLGICEEMCLIIDADAVDELKEEIGQFIAA